MDCWTFSKDFSEILIVIDVQILRKHVASGLYLNGEVWQEQLGDLTFRS
jgi:hypothetical protein